jgi:hypothetical protein
MAGTARLTGAVRKLRQRMDGLFTIQPQADAEISRQGYYQD